MGPAPEPVGRAGRSPVVPQCVGGEAVDVVSAAERATAGLDHWVDGTMGIARSPGRTLVVAPNGRDLARHDLERGGFLDGLDVARQSIVGRREPMDHAAGGPLYRDRGTGALVLVYHAERFHDGDPGDYWSWLGLAVSHDDGHTFVDLGAVLTPSAAEHDPARERPVDVGPGGMVERDGHWYLYFFERGGGASWLNLGVARVAVDELARAAGAGRAPVFHKFHDGHFDAPALGGPATDLLPFPRERVIWFDVAYVPAVGMTLLVHSTIVRVGERDHRWATAARWSDDGRTWSEAQLLGAGSTEEMLYVTIDSGGPEQRIVTGDRCTVYRVSSPSADRWSAARLQRLEVSWHNGGTEGDPAGSTDRPVG